MVDNKSCDGWGSIVRNENRRPLGRPVTGIIQKDRIWEQWYEAEAFETTFPKMTQKDYLLSCISDEPDRQIIDYRGKRTFTVKEFCDYIQTFERAFAAEEYEVGDVVCSIGFSTPELYAIKYSCTSLGMITCNLNVLNADKKDESGESFLFQHLKNVNPRYIFVQDILVDKVYEIVNNPLFENACKIIMPLDFCVQKFEKEKAVLGIKNASNKLKKTVINNSISLKSFLRLGKNISDSDIKEVYFEKMPCNISFTSGTTGSGKAVLLSHDANNALALQQKIGKVGMRDRDRQIAALPPFLAFWDANIVHTVLCLKGENVIELSPDYDKFPEYFKKHKNIAFGITTQYFWSSVLNLSKEDIAKYCGSLHNVVVGGERCDINEQKKFYQKTGLLQVAGYGASEVNTSFSISHPNCRKIGTAGIPLPFNNVMIVDDDYNNLTYNIPGRLFITGPCLMNGYFIRPDLTQKSFYVDEEGTTWYNTGDYAVMDEDGCLTVLDRYVPPVEIRTVKGKEKVNILDIAEIIKGDADIKNCKITCYDGWLVAHITFRAEEDKSPESLKTDLLEYMKNNIEEMHQPDFVRICDELPRTSVGKVDYRILTEQGEQIVRYNKCMGKLTVVE